MNNKQKTSTIFQTNPPDLYYINLAEYPSNKILKTFFEFERFRNSWGGNNIARE